MTGIMHLAIATTALGDVTMAQKDMTRGLTPRDPKGLATWFAALAQGGGAGILGDFMFGSTNRFGGSPAETVAVLVLGEDVGTLLRIWNDAKAGNAKDMGPGLLHFGLNNTPLINLFYVRSALDYLFLNSAMETMNPG